MKIKTAIFILVSTGLSTFALPKIDQSLVGTYTCENSGGMDVKMITISQDGRIDVENKNGVHHGKLVNRSNLLSPLKKELGISLFTLQDENNESISNLEFLKTKSGKLLISESGSGIGGYREPNDESQSVEYKAKISPDAVCTLN